MIVASVVVKVFRIGLIDTLSARLSRPFEEHGELHPWEELEFATVGTVDNAAAMGLEDLPGHKVRDLTLHQVGKLPLHASCKIVRIEVVGIHFPCCHHLVRWPP